MKGFAVILLMLFASAVVASPATRPTEAHFASCITSDCHASLKQSAVVHAPVASDACDSCHELKSAKDHTFSLVRSGAEMCTFCHEFDISDMPVVHKPVATGECLGCHDPHGGTNRSIVREASVSELCARCHESVTLNHDFIHTPVARGQCDTCHPSHASRFPRLVDAAGADLCLACHKDLERRLASSRFSHKAIDKGCEKCHNVHASDHANVLTASAPELCTQCHEQTKKDIAAATVKHSIASDENGCITCHTPHASDYIALARELPSKTCLSCHRDPIKGVQVAVVPEAADPKLIKHGPIRDGQCGGCHAAHGGTRPNLLAKNYSEKFYHLYDPTQYELCFTCHDPRLASDPLTTAATEFRNGDKNLHFLHINEGDKGRGCGVCHAVHAADNDRMVKAKMRFGQRELPINFQRTATGGSCQTGCHVSYGYDRITAIPVTTQPATRPAPAIARAALDQPQYIQWVAQDITGAKVTIPLADKATVLVMLRASQHENAQLLHRISETLEDRPQVQLVIILSGATSPSDASPPPTARLILDPQFKLADSFSVRGWPATLVLRPDGLVISRISGSPQSLPTRLAAYVDVAAGQSSTASVDKPDDKQRRDLRAAIQAARKLLDDDRTDPADRIVEASLKLDPTNPDLLMLRARCADKFHQTEYAKRILQDVIAAHPTLREPHGLLAQIYEREQNWQAAAKEYKTMQQIRPTTRPDR